MSLVGHRFSNAGTGRLLTVTEAYDGDGRDDPPGWYYVYDDAPGTVHWISASAVPVRFENLERVDD